MVSGVPVIAVNSSGPAEIIQHGVTGVLVPPGDVTRLAQSMIKMASDVRLRTEIATAAFKTVIKMFSAETTADRLHEVYQLLLSEKGIPCESV